MKITKHKSQELYTCTVENRLHLLAQITVV